MYLERIDVAAPPAPNGVAGRAASATGAVFMAVGGLLLLPGLALFILYMLAAGIVRAVGGALHPPRRSAHAGATLRR